MIKKRYFLELDSKGVTPSQLKRLGKARQLEYLVDWFHTYYEDPVHRTSYDGQEGGYLWNHGGPYDASEQLYDEFSGIVSDARIAEAVEEIETEGTTEWAASPNHPDEEQDHAEREFDEAQDVSSTSEQLLELLIRRLTSETPTHFGTEEDEAGRRNLLAELDRLSGAASAIPYASIGHNNPPPDDGATASPPAFSIAVEAAFIRAELGKQAPDALAVAQSVSRLKTVTDWLLKKGDIAADGFAKTIGVSSAVAVAATASPILAPLRELMGKVVDAAVSWLKVVISAI